MTDNEIIKALEHCGQITTRDKCGGCPLNDGRGFICISDLSRLAFDLINLQKAEIELWKENNRVLQYCNKVNISSTAELHDRLRTAKADAIKEFAERLKKELKYFASNVQDECDVVDNLVKEMVGDVR